MSAQKNTLQITIGGTPASGKSSAGKRLAEYYNKQYPDCAFYDSGEIMREIAKKLCLPMDELMKLREGRAKNAQGKTFDEEVDEWQKELASSGKSFILVSRLGFFFAPHSIKIMVSVSPEVAVQRFFESATTRQEGAVQQNHDQVRTLLQRRKEKDRALFKELYGIEDIYASKHYDLSIDNDELTLDETVDIIIKEITWLQSA